MELIIGALVTLITEAVKYVNKKVGKKEVANSIVILVTLGLSIIGGAIYYITKKQLPAEALENIVQIWGLSMLFYQVAVKKLITPAIEESQKRLAKTK